MLKNILCALGATTLLLGGQAMATPVTLNAGDSAIFNFSGPGAPVTIVTVTGYVPGQSAVGTMSFYAGANLAGGLIYVDSDVANVSGTDTRSEAALLDGLSVKIDITSGSFKIDPEALYWNGSVGVDLAEGTVGFDSTATTPTPSVPEPGSLLLVAVAGLALGAARRRIAA